MSKIVHSSHVTEGKGIAAFDHYCANHSPKILWREESKHDYGVDGEVEITRTNADGKIEATAEILKIQLKSTEKGSYIHKENEESFVFYPTNDDLEYWSKHLLKVVLVIYVAKTDTLYAKEIPKINPRNRKSKERIPIEFSKQENRLGNHDDFILRFSAKFRSRVNYDISEIWASNIFKFKSLPKFVYQYGARFTNVKDIFALQREYDFEIPAFKIHSGSIWLMYDPFKYYPEFADHIIDSSSKEIHIFKRLLEDSDTRPIVISLLNSQIRQTFYGKPYFVSYNKKYRRYYFRLKHGSMIKTVSADGKPAEDIIDEEIVERREQYKPRIKRRRWPERAVVIYKTYGKHTFYRHHAFEIEYKYADEGLYLVINPKYLFTSDGKNPLDDPELITKFTNNITKLEFNNQNLAHVHFIYSFLRGRDSDIVICSLPDSEITLGGYKIFEVEFGIAKDNTKLGKRKKSSDTNQISMDL